MRTTPVCFAVDLGSHNMRIAKAHKYSSDTLPIVTTITDPSGARIIPNSVYYSSSSDSIRTYGNNTNASKTLQLDAFRNPCIYTTDYKTFIFGEQCVLPIPYVANNLCCYVKDIIDVNIDKSEHISKLIYTVSSYKSLTSGIIRESDRSVIQTLLAMNPKVTSQTELIEIDDMMTLVGAYIQRYVLDSTYPCNIPTNCIILDIGGSKTHIIYLSVLKIANNKMCVKILQHTTKGTITIDNVDTEFTKTLIRNNLKRKPNSEINKIPQRHMMDAVKNIRHILSTNKSYIHSLSLPETDIDIHANRTELDSALIQSGYINQIETLLDDIKLDNAVRNQMIVVGGCSRICKIDKVVQSFITLSQCSITILRGMHADEAVAIGAGFIGSILDGSNISLICSRPVEQNIQIISNNAIVKSFAKGSYATTAIGNCSYEDISYQNSTLILAIPQPNNSNNANVVTQIYNDDNITVSTELIHTSEYYRNTKVTVWGLTNRIVIDSKIKSTNIVDRVSGVSIDLDSISNRCQQIELKLQNIEDNIKMQRTLINDIEEYYNDSSKLIEAMRRMLKIKPEYFDLIRKTNSTPLGVMMHIIEHFCNNNPQSPIKELYEFYVLCSSYLFDKATTKESEAIQQKFITNQQQILNLINNPEAICILLKACEVAKSYKISALQAE